MSGLSIDGSVLRELLRSLADRRWLPGQRLPGGRELAAWLGVSLRTVQKAVRRGARYGLLRVSPRRRAVVLDGAPEKAGRLLQRFSARPAALDVAVLVPEQYLRQTNNPFYSAMIRHTIEQCTHRRIRARVVEWPLQRQVDTARSLVRRNISAAVIIGFRFEYTPSLFVLHEQRFPVMVFNRRLPGLDLPTVRLDDHAAARSVADTLVALGHRNLCMVTNLRSGSPAEGTNRDAGWLDRLDELGVTDTCGAPLLIVPWSDYPRGRHPIFSRLFEAPDPPTAMVFAAAPWVRDFLAEPRCARLRVPDEVSLVVFEPGADVLHVRGYPSLSSVQADLKRVAQCITEVVEKMLAGDLKPPSIRVPMNIVLTDSIGPAPSL